MTDQIKRFIGDESGTTAIEYGIIASGIVVAIIGAISVLSNDTNNLFLYIVNQAATILRT